LILAGDELGNSQGGNNNAYAQDNDTGWVDWSGLDRDPDFTEKVRELIRLRRELPLLRQARYIHGRMPTEKGFCDISWLHPDGRPMHDGDWSNGQQLALFFTGHEEHHEYSPITHAIAIGYNASDRETRFLLPTGLATDWVLRFFSCEDKPVQGDSGEVQLPARSMMLATMGLQV
jgi:glycogen operon protein